MNQRFLKKGLRLACAAVGLIMATGLTANAQDYTVSPSGRVFNVETVTLTFEGYTVSVNPDAVADVVYSPGFLMSPSEYEPSDTDKKVASVVADGSVVTVSLGENYTTPGFMFIYYPEGCFTLTDGSETFQTPAMFNSFIISQYLTEPEDYGEVEAPFSTLKIIGDNLTLAPGANIASIYIRDDMDNMFSADSYTTELDAEGMTVMTVTFGEPWDKMGSIGVIVPENTLAFNGVVYDEEISLAITVTKSLPAAVATPASGTLVKQLDRIEINWDNETPLEASWWGSEPVMLNDGNSDIDISEFVKIESETVETPWGGEVAVSSKIVIDFGENPYTAKGLYTITLPEEYAFLTGWDYMPTPETELTYVVDPDFQGYFTSKPSCNVPEGAIEAYPGDIILSWPNTTLVQPNGDPINPIPGQRYNLDKSYLKVTLDGQTIDTSWDDFWVYFGQTTNEATGEKFDTYLVKVYPFSLFGKHGVAEVTILPGAVHDNNGLTNELFTLKFYLYQIIEGQPPIFYPAADEAKFEEGIGEVIVKYPIREFDNMGMQVGDILGWYTPVEINPNPIQPAYVEVSGEETEDGMQKGRRDVTQYLSVVDGAVRLDVSQFGIGKYDLNLTQGSVFFEGGYITTEAFYTFQIVERTTVVDPDDPEKEITYVLNPANGETVEDLMVITLEFPETKNVKFYENNPMAVAVLENVTTGATYSCQEATSDTKAETEGKLYILTFIPYGEEEAVAITETGEYNLTIRALAVTDEEGNIKSDLPVIKATYTILEKEEPGPGPDTPPQPGPDDPNDGVAGIQADANGLFTVYNLQGIKVLTTAEADDLLNLEGLYIVNGKKVLIRK